MTVKQVISQGFWGSKSIIHHFTDTSFTMLAYGKSILGPFASCTDIITWFGHRLASRPGALPEGLIRSMKPAVIFAEEVLVKPSIWNLILLFFVCFTSRLKTKLPSAASELITSCYSPTGALSWARESEMCGFKNRKSVCGGQCWYCKKKKMVKKKKKYILNFRCFVF